jgi:hypothetical protein
MNPCVTCKHLFVVNKNDRWYAWLCMKLPLLAWENEVTGEKVADPPYMRCKDRRMGPMKGRECPDWETGINSLSPAKLGVGPDGSTFEKMEKTMEGTNG